MTRLDICGLFHIEFLKKKTKQFLCWNLLIFLFILPMLIGGSLTIITFPIKIQPLNSSLINTTTGVNNTTGIGITIPGIH